ncbi:hypothetical protein QYE76_048661 [Lolium multiflorum]|uniref:Transposase (putative) gypsy type domain-containing protein n=1 Tax=Lolium multiflorum TaxID=4521 RepID=A0AAD8WFA0_LOLMU|nr:hypothetical protein QYE76_048661 [Lolium multiflorum]
MAAKVQESENKKASKARSREGVRRQWWPCETTDAELRELQNEGMISERWSFMRDSDVPKPDADERVMTKAWVERGLSLPCSEFFLSILDTYGLQPHNICPNSYLLLSNFATLCEGHLGIRPDVKLWQFFFRVKKETKDKAMLNCGSMTFMLRSGRMYPPHDSHESVRYWNAGWFYVKNAPVLNVHDGLPPFSNKLASGRIGELELHPHACPNANIGEGRAEDFLLDTLAEESLRNILRVPVSGESADEDPEDPEEEEERAPRKAAPRPSKRSRAKVSGSEAGASGEASAKKPKVTKPPPLLSAVGRPSRPNILGTTNPNPTTARTNVQEHITKYMHKKSPAIGPSMPAPPSAPQASPQPSPPPADQSPAPAASTPPEIIPEQKALHYELHKNIALQRRVTISQAEKIQRFQTENADLKKKLSEAQGASSSLAAASSELETLRASQKNLEAKLAEAEQKLAEKNSELTRKVGEFELKRKTDSDTIQKQQKELGGLRKYMETAESCWDLLNSDVMDPLGYDEERRSQFPRNDLLQLAGEDCKDLISASRKICHNLNIKKSRTCDVRKLIKRMDLLPELVVDLQSSSARGAAAMSLAMCLAHNPKLNLDRVTAGVPPDADVDALLDAVSGYDTRIARRIRHDEFYEKAVLPADEPLEAELLKEREAETRPAQSGSQYTWTSSKDKGGATSPTAAEEDEDEDVSSPVKDAEKESPADAKNIDANVETSPAKEK